MATLYFMFFGFLVMFCFYTLKTLREPLLLSTSEAEIKSYAYAVIAIIVFFVVQLYDAAYRIFQNAVLNVGVGAVLIVVQSIFLLLIDTGMDIGFAYYVWTGVFSVLLTAQFWAFTTDCFNLHAGQRLFPLIMFGASLGAVAAPLITRQLFEVLGVVGLMLIVNIALALMLPLVSWSRQAVPPESRASIRETPPRKGQIIGGFALVLRNRYLRMIAVLVILLNWVNTTGEYILAEMVIEHVEQLVAADPTLDRGTEIANFYGLFFSAVNTASLVLLLLIVSRVFAWIGVEGAILILPVIALVGYGMIAFIPIFSVIAAVKMMENATDYSLMNTARHALFLPLSSDEKYQSKFVIDAFFWRCGDLFQALVVYLGLRYLDFDTRAFALLNMVLALFWLGAAVRVRKLWIRDHSRPQDRPAG